MVVRTYYIECAASCCGTEGSAAKTKACSSRGSGPASSSRRGLMYRPALAATARFRSSRAWRELTGCCTDGVLHISTRATLPLKWPPNPEARGTESFRPVCYRLSSSRPGNGACPGSSLETWTFPRDPLSWATAWVVSL